MSPDDSNAGVRLDQRPPGTVLSRLWLMAAWITRHEIWVLALAAPLLFFPRLFLPWLGLAMIAVIWIARLVTTGRLSVATPLDAPMLVLLMMGVVGVAIAIEPALSWPRFWSLLLGVLVYYGLVNWLRSERQVVSMVYLLGALTLVAAVLSLLGTDWHYGHMLPVPWLYDRIPTLVRGLPSSGVSMTGDLFNPRATGITMGFLAPVFLAPALFGRERRLRLFSGTVAAVATLLLLLSQTVQGLAALLAGVFLILVWRWRWMWLVVPAVLIGVGVAVVLHGPQAMLVDLLSIDNFAGKAIVLRLDIWSRALAMLHDLPYTGIGLNNFPVVLSNFYPGFLLGPEPHAHNLYLQTALDLGLVGLLALLWLAAAWFAGVRRSYRAAVGWDYRILLVGLAAGVTAYLVHGVFDAVMLGAKSVVALWMMLALGVSLPKERRAHQTRASKSTSSDGLRAGDALTDGDPIPLEPPAPGGAALAGKGRLVRWLPVLLLVVATLASVPLFPSAWRMNLGAVQALQSLYQAQQSGAGAVPAPPPGSAHLQEALRYDPGRVFAYDLLGRLYAWSGDYPAALQAFSGRLDLDIENPWRKYYPPEAILQAVGAPPIYNLEGADVLSRIYTHWMRRYPQRAEGYLRMALLAQRTGLDRRQIAALVQEGIANGAQPDGVLGAALEAFK